MFGIGAQEMVVIGLLFLVIFGPNKLPQMARDFGRFVNEARRSIDEFKEELTSSAEDDEEEERERRRKRSANAKNANAKSANAKSANAKSANAKGVNAKKNGGEEEHDL